MAVDANAITIQYWAFLLWLLAVFQMEQIITVDQGQRLPSLVRCQNENHLYSSAQCQTSLKLGHHTNKDNNQYTYQGT